MVVPGPGGMNEQEIKISWQDSTKENNIRVTNEIFCCLEELPRLLQDKVSFKWQEICFKTEIRKRIWAYKWWEDILSTGENNQTIATNLFPQHNRNEEEGKQFNVSWSSSYFSLSLLTGLVKMVLKIDWMLINESW